MDSWSKLIPEQQWKVYTEAINALRQTGLPFMLGGGFALGMYIDKWRNTKDIDFYILPETHEPVARALSAAGFEDYYPQLAYDRGWIYRSTREGVIVDLIWSMANRRAQVDASWLDHARSQPLRDQVLKVIAAEELLWCKLYVLQRDHCDWPDVMNLLYATAPSLDWERLLKRLGTDEQLLKAAVTLFSWLCPERSAQIPESVRRRFDLPAFRSGTEDQEQTRIRLLDSRGWFAPLLPKDAPLEV